MTETEHGFRAYVNWQRERADYISHFAELHRRNDLLQKRLDEAQAIIARMQANKLHDGRVMSNRHTLGSVFQNYKTWSVRIQIGKQKWLKSGFKTPMEATTWLQDVNDQIGFEELRSYQESAKASMAAKLELLMRNQPKEVANA